MTFCNHALDHTGLAGDLASPIHRLDPRAKVLGLLAVTLVAVTTPVALWPVFGACALALAVVALLARVPARTLWQRGRIVLLPVALVALIAPLTSSWEVAAGVAAKASIGVVAAVLLGATTAFPAMLRGLEALRLPRLMVLIAGLMYRYLFVITEEVGRTRDALVSRAYRPRHALQAGAVGSAAGHAVPALLPPWRARPPRDARARLQRADAGAHPAAAGVGGPRVRRPRARRTDPAARRDRMISARGLAFAYPNGHGALSGIDLEVAEDERVALLGPNGAGKTTLMLHLNGLLTGGGELDVAGLRVGRDDMRELRGRVGLVFQDPDDQLFMPTVREDVAFGPLNLGLSAPEALARVDEALDRVRMGHAADRAPHALSMGERRRVAIATVLAMRPRLLVLDEPSANLDPRGRRELVEVLDDVGGTMLVATHDLPLAAQLCERAVVLDGGRIVADGPVAEILADRGAAGGARPGAAAGLRPRPRRA